MELAGPWRASPADTELRRTFADVDHDDSDWPIVAVPSHWTADERFADASGSVLFRTSFDLAPQPNRREWLVCDGLFSQGDVFLNGVYLGDTEGYHLRHTFEISELARAGRNTLALEVSSSRHSDPTAKRALTGWHQEPEFNPPGHLPGGIHRRVHRESTGPVRIRDLRVLCVEANAERAIVSVTARLDAHEPLRAEFSCAAERDGTDTAVGQTSEVRDLAAGANEVEMTIAIEEPDLWWPRALGDQPLHRIVAGVSVAGEVSHTRHKTTGLRSVELRKWILDVNGEQIFAKGVCVGPSTLLPVDTPECSAAHVADIDLAASAGLDLVRLHSHVSLPATYEHADRIGMMIWQDLPLRGGYARGTRGQAKTQATRTVDLLGHHPSIVLWCGHDEPFATTDRSPRRASTHQQLPSWNKTVLDPAIKRALTSADPSRPVIAHSGTEAHFPRLDGTDTHLWIGSRHGSLDDLADAARRMPRRFRFVSEFGAASVPVGDDFVDRSDWPLLDWEELETQHGLDRADIDLAAPSDQFVSYGAWKAASQAHQAELIRTYVELLRKLRFRPTGGFCAFHLLRDAWPRIGPALVGHDGRPKPAFSALAAACAPVIISAEPLPAELLPGTPVALDLHVINDSKLKLGRVAAHGELVWRGGSQEWNWRGRMRPNAVRRIGTIPFVVPNAPGPISLELSLIGKGLQCSNRYASFIGPQTDESYGKGGAPSAYGRSDSAS